MTVRHLRAVSRIFATNVDGGRFLFEDEIARFVATYRDEVRVLRRRVAILPRGDLRAVPLIAEINALCERIESFTNRPETRS